MSFFKDITKKLKKVMIFSEIIKNSNFNFLFLETKIETA